MSAPDTDVEKQRRKHPVPIWGIMVAVLFGVLMAVAVVISAFDGQEPGEEQAGTGPEAEATSSEG